MSCRRRTDTTQELRCSLQSLDCVYYWYGKMGRKLQVVYQQ